MDHAEVCDGSMHCLAQRARFGTLQLLCCVRKGIMCEEEGIIHCSPGNFSTSSPLLAFATLQSLATGSAQDKLRAFFSEPGLTQAELVEVCAVLAVETR